MYSSAKFQFFCTLYIYKMIKNCRVFHMDVHVHMYILHILKKYEDSKYSLPSKRHAHSDEWGLRVAAFNVLYDQRQVLYVGGVVGAWSLTGIKPL